MKKLLLSLGAFSAVVAPVAAVVACGSKTETPAKTETPTTPAKPETPDTPAKTNPVTAGDAMHPTLQSTKNVADLKVAIVPANPTPVTVAAAFGIESTKISASGNSVAYTWNKDDSTLTVVSTIAGKKLTQVITITPKSLLTQSKWVEAEIEEFFLEDGETAVKNYSDTTVFNAVKTAFDAKFAGTGLTLGLATHGQMSDQGHGTLSYALVINSEAPFTISDSDLGTTDTTSGYQFKNGNTTLDVNNKVYKMDADGEFYYDLTEVNMNKVIEAKWSTKFATTATAAKSAFVLYIQKQGTGHTFEIEKLLHNGDKVLVSDQYDEATVTE